jgi:hypothetical protein
MEKVGGPQAGGLAACTLDGTQNITGPGAGPLLPEQGVSKIPAHSALPEALCSLNAVYMWLNLSFLHLAAAFQWFRSSVIQLELFKTGQQNFMKLQCLKCQM